MKFYKLRSLAFLYISRFISTILAIEKTPLVSVATLIKKDDKLLFLQLSYMDGLGLPGGIVQGMENAEEAVKREVKEETALTVISTKYFASFTSLFRGHPTLSLVFLVEAQREIDSSEEGSLVWLKPEEALGKMAYEVNKKALRRYLER